MVIKHEVIEAFVNQYKVYITKIHSPLNESSIHESTVNLFTRFYTFQSHKQTVSNSRINNVLDSFNYMTELIFIETLEQYKELTHKDIKTILKKRRSLFGKIHSRILSKFT